MLWGEHNCTHSHVICVTIHCSVSPCDTQQLLPGTDSLPAGGRLGHDQTDHCQRLRQLRQQSCESLSLSPSLSLSLSLSRSPQFPLSLNLPS